MAANVQQTQERKDTDQEWRRAQYEEMGFSAPEALALAKAVTVSYTGGKSKNERKLEWTMPLDWKKVKAALDAGCTPTQALEIFL